MDFLCATFGLTSGLRAVTAAGQLVTGLGGEGDQVYINNLGPNKVFVLDGDGTQLAVAPTDNATPNGKGIAVPSGVQVFTLRQGASSLHFICSAAETATVCYSRVKGA